jgi:carboxyl-terminal processing protease
VASTKPSHGSHVPQGVQKHTPKFTATFVVVAVLVASVISFIAGTRGTELLGMVGGAFGVEVRTGELDLSSVQETYRKLSAKFDGKLDEQKLVESANKGLVSAAGDDYTQFFTAEEARELQNDLSGNIGGGIGAELGNRNEAVTVIRPLENSPAAKAGIAAGDVVIGVNGESTKSLNVDDVVKKIRGEIGSTAKITVERDGEVKEFSVTREEIIAPDVESKVVDGIGVMTVSRFDKETGSKVRAAAEDFKRQNVKGVVLDLRGNGGGYLEAGIDVASVWLNGQVVVSERRDNKVIDERKSGKNPVLGDTPTTVLINAGSASASEIVAGALHDHGKAKLVGEKSFGKGSVQELIELSTGDQLKVTIARWFTPNGKNITKEGIAPDTKVDLTKDDINANRDPQLDAALKQLAR